MELIRDPKILARAQATFDLSEFADCAMRQNLRRKHPQASEAELRERFAAWAEKRPYTGLAQKIGGLSKQDRGVPARLEEVPG